MRFCILLALLGSALALQAPVEYVYQYQARVATGMQSGRPQYAGTGIRAQVKITVDKPGEGYIEVSNVKVGEANQIVGNNGRDEMQIPYQNIYDKALQLPFRAHFTRTDGETVMEVPDNELVWVTNVRRGIVNFFRTAPIIDSSCVKPSANGTVEPQAFSRVEDTYAGRCQVGYTLTPATSYDVSPGPSEDIQAPDAKKGPGGCAVKIKADYYKLKSAIDFSTCSDRAVLLQTGAGNLTNLTSSTYRDVATKTHISQYILKGEPGKFRIESGVIESNFIMNPFGVEGDKIVIVSNQTMQLSRARHVPRGVDRNHTTLRPIDTWRHQVQSPFEKPQGQSPRFIKYQPAGKAPMDLNAFYEQIATGFQWNATHQDASKRRVIDAIHHASQSLSQQNRDRTDSPQGYGGSEDGRAAQDLLDSHRLIRTLPMQKLKEIDQELKKKSDISSELYVEALAVAGSGDALKYLMDKIQQGEISDNRTASIFFNLANNIQSPEAISKMMQFVMSLKEEERVTVSLLCKINFSLLARRMCVSPDIKQYSHMHHVYGKQCCDRSAIVSQYLPHLEQRITTGSHPTWVKILNIIALADLGAPESLATLEKVARGEVSQDRFVRYAAIHGMAVDSFDNSSRDQIFNILQPIAESQVEDYRVRQVAYNSLLSWKPNVTFLQRMAASSYYEPSVQMQSFTYWVIESLALVQDPSFAPLSVAARNLLPVTQYMNPSFRRSLDYFSSTYLRDDLVGATSQWSWSTDYRKYFPRELYSFMSGKYGRFNIPLLETVTYGNSQQLYAKLRSMVEDFGTPSQSPSSAMNRRRSSIHDEIQSLHRVSSPMSAASEEVPQFYHYSKLFRTSQIFLPLTDQLYTQLKSTVAKMMQKSGSESVVMHKYFNPVEVNVLQPTPVGLWVHTEVSTPTLMFANVTMKVQAEPMFEDNKLPALRRLDVSAEGIVKVISKANTYTYVLAPWTNKTIMVAVDNEKSVSIPMKYQMAADLLMPARALWGEITPKFQGSSKVPVMKIRNVPFTAIGKFLPSPNYAQEISSFDQIQWLARKEQRYNGTIQISEKQTGLKAEIHYEGEPQYPFNQRNIYDYIMEPSRQIALLASPSVKNYDLTLYHNPGSASTQKIGFCFRHIMQPATSSGPQIQVPESSSQPIDVDVSDTLPQRQQKLMKFSNQETNEYAVQLNFTGSQTKKYEASLVIAQDERTIAQENTKRTFTKLQLSFLQKNDQAQDVPKRVVVFGVNRPQLQPMTTRSEFREAHRHQSLAAPISANLYEGSSCSPSQQPLVRAIANLTVTENRLEEAMRVTQGSFSYNTTSEFYRLAVYDHLNLTVDWKTPSLQVQNITYRIQDLAEGYLFPKIVKNHFASNHPQRMIVLANRSISDDRVDAWVYLPQETCHAERVSVYSWFDEICGFTTNVVPSRSERLFKSSAPSQKCYIEASRVKTFDGVVYEKQATECATTLAMVRQGDDSIVVTANMSPYSGPAEVQILSTKESLNITIKGQFIEVNGEVMPQSESLKIVMDSNGRVLAKIERTLSTVEVTVLSKLTVFIKDGNQIMIELNQRFTGKGQGLCGDFNSEPMDDLRGPTKCVYSKSQGPLFAASWITMESPCTDEAVKPLLQTVQQFQVSCSNGKRSLVSATECEIQAYPIKTEGDLVCISEIPQKVCQTPCRDGETMQKNLMSKCWHHDTAPSHIIADIPQGYSETPAQEHAELEASKTYTVPKSCIKPLSVKRDDSCYLMAYPVMKVGPMLCVTQQTTQQCKAECNIGDITPIQMDAKCWNQSHAPEEVKQSVFRGYTTANVTQDGQFSQRLPIDKPERCLLPSH